LARAGVLPAVAEGALGKWPKAWDTAIASPGMDPMSAIEAALRPFAGDADMQSPEALVAALAERAQTTGRGIVLFVDQLEELVTLSEPESRKSAAQLLTAFGAQVTPGVRCVAAARRD